MSQLGVILQESLRAEREARTILGLLTHQMDAGAGGVHREEDEEEEEEGPRRRRSLKDCLRFTGMGCCGATWVFRPPTLTLRHAQQHQEQEQERTPLPQQQQQHQHHHLQETNPGQIPNPLGPDCVSPTPAGSGMNLAAALAAERQFRGSQEPDAGVEGSRGQNLGGGGSSRVPGTPWRVSLMRLLEETEETEKGGGAVGNDSVCCVCMGRKKGAAFIPCGHTFCRVCSRELWLNRGTCPLCNRSILEILDIF